MFDQHNFGRRCATRRRLGTRVRSDSSSLTAVRSTRHRRYLVILDNLSHVVRERFKIHRQVRVHSAHGRITGFVLLALPAALGIGLSLINPEHMKLLFEERVGQMMLMGVLVMQTVGFVWIRRVIKIEV